MDLDETAEESAFRAEARAFLRAHAPAPRADEVGAGADSSIFVVDHEEERDFVRRGRAWQRVKYDHGWAGIDWPRAFGGRGGTVVEASIFGEEEEWLVSPWLTHNLGFGIAGPAVLRFGSEAQKARFVPAMLRGEAVWCQLFSEPWAGSDLGAVRTSAVRDGDEWVINGQKVWSSRAHFSDWGLLVARSDFEATKYRGISCFAVDMRTPGVDVRPLRQINGSAHFNEVFLTDVRVPNADMIGEPEGGWAVVMGTLAGERSLLGTVRGAPRFAELARSARRTHDAGVRQRLAAAFTRGQLLTYLGYRVRTAASLGAQPGPESSVMKLLLSQHVAASSELALDLFGAAGLLDGDAAPGGGRWAREFVGHFSFSIGGGTDEVQRNTIAEKVLGLAPDHRVDKGVPFRQIPW